MSFCSLSIPMKSATDSNVETNNRIPIETHQRRRPANSGLPAD
ncbi:hypothetical protein [Methylomonas sp. 11b]|nr:hypothetical protein [Methylomonas sp. 11b]